MSQGPGYNPGVTPPAEQKAANSSLGDLLGDVTADLSTLMRQELELAKAEARESAKRAGRGGAMYAGAGIAGHFVLLFLSIALWWALGAYLIGLGWSAVVVAVIWAIIAAVLYTRAKKEMEAVKGMPKTAETVKRIPESLKPSEEPR
ncbi:phage holin family protein [Sinomonas sp.]|uniref:phage holin family protein n=1 Tax=Sinomonas sp. TaxID=1914986 RepID=UPI002B7C0ACE|nr:phage holin family protein [Sinomonas sp.]